MKPRLEIIKQALAKEELVTFLMGKGKEYFFICPYADMPTDPDQAFDIIKEYFMESNDSTIWYRFEYAIKEMTQQSLGAWLSVYYLSVYLSFRDFKKQEFIHLDEIIKNITSGLLRFKNELSDNKRWGGAQFENGLWDDAIRLLKILNEDFHLKIDLDKDCHSG